MIFRGDDGIHIFCDSFRLEKPRASLLVVHGMGEHSGRYAELVRECRALKLDVHMLDLRGHGRSQGTRGHFRSMEEHHRDIDAWLAHLIGTGDIRTDIPFFLLGHSLGALVTATFAAKYVAQPLHPPLAGLIYSAPCFGLPPKASRLFEGKLARRMPEFLRSIQVPTGIRAEQLSHDKEEVRRYKEDPLVHPWITPAAYLAIEDSIQRLPKLVPELGYRTLMLLSGRDEVVSTKAAEKLAQKLKVAHPGLVEVRMFHTFFHEPFHEARRERAFVELKKWMLKCLPTRKSSSKKNSSKSSGKKATERANLH